MMGVLGAAGGMAGKNVPVYSIAGLGVVLFGAPSAPALLQSPK